jgi:hypothetical protein
MNWGAAEITAAGTAVAAILGGLAAVVKIVLSRPKMPVAEEILEQLADVQGELLKLAAWAHDAQMVAAAAGLELPEPPDSIKLLGRRPGEGGRHRVTGWRASVKAQTGEQPAIAPERPMQRDEPQTWPERRRPPLPPPNGR